MRHSILSGRKDTICLDNDLSINSAPLFKINKDVFEQGEQKNKTQGNKGNKGNKWNSGPRGTRGTVEYGNWGTRRTRQQLIFIFSFCVANFHPGGKSIKSCVSKYPALQNLDVMTPSSETQGLFSPFFTFPGALFSRPFRLSLAPTICPWVSKDVTTHTLTITFFLSLDIFPVSLSLSLLSTLLSLGTA